ncbi:MAG: chromosome segregation protein SMC [bacterium]|nr:chromosome segregation protein SMC [bacterium]
MGRVRLESLRLEGFKSFPDIVELTFPGDVSAIVGPNGCGKSNIVDAILWVLGEQSPSLLRLKQMGDVVFSGSANRTLAGTAEVRLTLAADDGRWDDTEGRIELSRRVLRSGPSDYRINGRAVRLKDVVDELLSVGLGTRNYSIIEQGRVGQVLSARPTDRRVLLEEAAGITRYKRRKHESELKLEHTRQNLLRLEDVIGEVGRSLRQLKRQAKQAEKHETFRAELKTMLRRLLVLEAHRLEAHQNKQRQRRGEAQNEVAAAASTLGGCEADLTTARQNLEIARQSVEDARSEVGKLLTSRERLETFLERSADLLDTLRGSLDRARREMVLVESGETGANTREGEATQRSATLQSALAEVSEQAKKAQAAESDARQKLRSAEQESASRREVLLRTISELTSSRNRLREVEREQDRLAYTLGQLEIEITRQDERRQELTSTFESTTTASREANSELEKVEQKRHEFTSQRAKFQDELAKAKHDADSLGHATWELRHRLAGIDREISRHGVALDHLSTVLPDDMVAGQLSDFIQPEAGLAGLLDRMWRDWLEMPVVNIPGLDDDQRAAIDELDGRIRLAIATKAPPAPPAPEIPGATSLLDRAGIDVSNMPWISRVLPPSYSCERAEVAAQLAEKHPHALFADPDGVIWCGRTMEPPTSGGQPRGTLALREERERLTSKIESTSSQVEQAVKRRETNETNIAGVETNLTSIGRSLLEAEQARARARALEQAQGDELARIQRELESLESERERQRRLKIELRDRHVALEQESTNLEQRNRDLEKAVDEQTSILDRERESAGETVRHLDRWQAEVRLARERLTTAQAETERIGEEKKRLEQRHGELQNEIKKHTKELDSTEQEVVASRTRLAEELGLLKSAQERERVTAKDSEQVADSVKKLETEVVRCRETHEVHREALHAIEVEQIRLDGEWQRLTETTSTELECTPETLLEDEPDESQGEDELRTKIEVLREKIEKLGPVNLLALKEVDELHTRSEFLREQRKDLTDSLQSIEATIREIDATCTERFVNTFQQVNVVFTETFSHLFGGGTARLDLIDEDDPLESGIDITAQPPGKKNQSVQLLSGGEKALTALSLLIALFRIKPSPFCILDEVDAPLDDANVERLSDLVTEMTEHTQFVMITHNRRTMARAEVLYGVTMEEAGVSKLVSVKLEEA